MVNYQAIHENVDSFVERNGKPILYKGEFRYLPSSKLISRKLGIGIYDLFSNEKKVYLPSICRIVGIVEKANTQFEDILHSNTTLEEVRKDFEGFYMLKKKALREETSLLKTPGRVAMDLMSRLMLYQISSKQVSTSLLVHNMAIQQMEGKVVTLEDWTISPSPECFYSIDKNVVYQPTLTNALAFRDYFRLKKEFEKYGKDLDLDERVQEEIQRIPENLRGIGIERYVSESLNEWGKEMAGKTTRL